MVKVVTQERRSRMELRDSAIHEIRNRKHERQLAALENQPYNPVPINHAITQFTAKTRLIFSSSCLPGGPRNVQMMFVWQAKADFLITHFRNRLRMVCCRGKWTCCNNRYNCVRMRDEFKWAKLTADDFLPFVRSTRKICQRILAQGDPALDSLQKYAGTLKPVPKPAAGTTTKNAKKQRGIKSKSNPDAVVTELEYESAPVSYAINHFTKKFLLGISAHTLLGKGTKKKRQQTIRTAKFRFLKKHFRSILKLKKVEENWICCKNRFDALDPKDVITQIQPMLLLPFVKLSKVEAQKLFEAEEYEREQAESLVNQQQKISVQPTTLNTPMVSEAANKKVSKKNHKKKKDSSKSKKTLKKTSKKKRMKTEDSQTNDEPAEIVKLPTPPPPPIEEIVIESDTETPVKVEPPSPKKPSKKKVPKPFPVKPPKPIANSPAVNQHQEPKSSNVPPPRPGPPVQNGTYPNPMYGPRCPSPDSNLDNLARSADSDSDTVGKCRGSKRKRPVLSSDDDHPVPPQKNPPPAMKPCQVSLDRLRLSPPGLRESHEYRAYKRIRANKPLVVEDVRKLMIGVETVRQRLNSESDSDIEFNPDAVNSSAKSSSSSESVLSNETDSPSSPTTEQSGADTDEYGASEREEEAERERQRRHSSSKFRRSIVITKTVEERRQLREQRRHKKAVLKEKKTARGKYVQTFMGHLSYAPVGISYAVDSVTKKLKWDVFPFGVKVLGATLGKKQLDSLGKSQESPEWEVLKQAFILKHFKESFRVAKGTKKDEWTCCRNTVDFLDCKAFLKLFWNININ